MDILLIDNNDSFTYNIVEMLRQTIKNRFPDDSLNIIIRSVDEFAFAEAEEAWKLIISPGPGLPEDYPVLFNIMEQLASTKSILGICLGFQLICRFFGAALYNLPDVVHGQPRNVKVMDKNALLFRGEQNMKVGLYHSWAVRNESMPDTLNTTAVSDEGIIMGVQHKTFDIHAVQFHPESYITENGKALFERFLMG
ncbi:MAG: aminodeoxychorismate/anthranilate synthase component II [Bacteroidales bacterium]